ncbi:unnamed protein product, partial [Menidia menidia]
PACACCCGLGTGITSPPSTFHCTGWGRSSDSHGSFCDRRCEPKPDASTEDGCCLLCSSSSLSGESGYRGCWGIIPVPPTGLDQPHPPLPPRLPLPLVRAPAGREPYWLECCLLRAWIFWLLNQENVLWHSSQRCGLSPVCVFMWSRSR